MKKSLLPPICLQGRVTKVIFTNPENGYTVLQCQPEKGGDKITVVGHFTHNFSSEQVIFHGVYQEHPLHGRQFMALICEAVTQDLPMEKFLVTHLEGVGRAFAKKLMNAFGDKLSDVLNNSPEQIKTVLKLSEKRYERITKSWQNQKKSHQMVLELTHLGLHFSQIAKIIKLYGQHAQEKIEENPYRLIADMEAMSFQIVDSLALKLGFATDDMRRLEGAFLMLLQQATKDGHCGIHQTRLLDKADQLLRVGKPILQQALFSAKENGSIIFDKVQGQDCIFLPTLYEQEKTIANCLKAIMAKPLDMDLASWETSLDHVLEQGSFPLTQEQQEAARVAIQSKVFVLSGGPGVGKTTLIKILLKTFLHQKMTVALAAPTGRAAKRITESTGHSAKTIHRLLEYDPFSQTFGYHPTFLLPFDVIILDEASMLDVPLCASIMQAVKSSTRVIFVGDSDQLAAVGPGDVLRAIISSGKIPVVALKTIFRQAACSQIIVNAHRVNSGLMPQVDKNPARDFFLIRADTPENQQQKIIELVTLSLPTRFGFSPEDIQLLAPMNGGPLGVDSLNKLLQAQLNPPAANKNEMKHFSGVLRVHDKVIQVVNNYEKNIFNGDIGRIDSIDLQVKKFTVLFDKTKIEYQVKDLEQLRLAYAISVHKAQGSEYPAVVFSLSMSQRIMLKRNLLYTAITRGKTCVVVIGEPEALSFTIRHGELIKRIYKLEDWLRND